MKVIVLHKQKAFTEKLSIPDQKTICILLINKNGKVIWRTQGSLTEEKFLNLENAVKENIQ